MSDLAVPATLPVVRALLDEAKRKNYRSGVLGIRTRPEWAGADSFVHDDTTVTVVPCVSSLAVREALLERQREQWLVVLTDRTDDDLGAGVLSHLVFNRLRTPDPWEAVRHRFAATGIDPALTSVPAHRELASGLLAAAPTGGWPPAAGGVLTIDHAMGAVARLHLGLDDAEVDATSALTWTADASGSHRLADLRQLGGDVLVDTVLRWIARRSGAAGGPLLHLLRSGAAGDALPLGLLVGLLGDARDSSSGDAVQLARDSLIRLEGRLGGSQPAPHVLRAWAAESVSVLDALLHDVGTKPTAERLLARADALLAEVQAHGLAERSEVLPAGLTRRLARLADALRAATPDPEADGVSADALAQVERAWDAVDRHRLSGDDPRRAPFLAAVRLVRWLSQDDRPLEAGLWPLVERHGASDAWVDSAVNDAARGVGDADLGSGLACVLHLTRRRRARHDADFAAALVAHTADDPAAAHGTHRGVLHLEELLSTVVLPLARTTPVLLLVLDGMSVGVGHEVMADVLSRGTEGWAEALLPGQSQRGLALAVLPTLTEVSRTSLLCGELRTGGQDAERNGHRALALAHGLCSAVLFHKKPLDSTRPGYAVADDVGAAIDDLDGQPLVTCVLNTIDDALDRSDPSGTDWGADAVRHLEPLLTRARRAGRTVVMTADHGHIVERREGTMRPYPAISSGRSRDVTGDVGDGEVLVTGRRVVAPGGRAVLALDERLRYGPLKAGYHGGASPAEAVVPVTVLVNGAVPPGADLHLAAPQEPAWWTGQLSSAPAVLSTEVSAFARRAAQEPPTLFDDVPAEPSMPSAPSTHPAASAVVASATYREQRGRGGRVAVTDAQVTSLLNALLLSPSGRLPAAQACLALQVAPVALRGAVPHVQRLLNVEGYGVLTVDVDGTTLLLDKDLLRDQFAVSVMTDGVSPRRRREVIDALRRGTVPANGLDLLAVGLERFLPAFDADLDSVSAGGSAFKAVRGEYGAGKTFVTRFLSERALRRGFAAAEVQISETETPLHRLETVYRRIGEALRTSAFPPSAFRPVLDSWLFTLESDVVEADPGLGTAEPTAVGAAVERLLEQRLAVVSTRTPAFASALRAYRSAIAAEDHATADALAAWLGGQPHVAAAAKRAAGVRGDLDHFGAMGFLQGLLAVLRDSGHPGLLLVLDEVETLQRVRGDVRDKALNAIRQLIDEVDSGRYPGTVPGHHRDACLLRRDERRPASSAAGAADRDRLRHRRSLRQPPRRPASAHRLRRSCPDLVGDSRSATSSPAARRSRSGSGASSTTPTSRASPRR